MLMYKSLEKEIECVLKVTLGNYAVEICEKENSTPFAKIYTIEPKEQIGIICTLNSNFKNTENELFDYRIFNSYGEQQTQIKGDSYKLFSRELTIYTVTNLTLDWLNSEENKESLAFKRIEFFYVKVKLENGLESYAVPCIDYSLGLTFKPSIISSGQLENIIEKINYYIDKGLNTHTLSNSKIVEYSIEKEGVIDLIVTIAKY